MLPVGEHNLNYSQWACQFYQDGIFSDHIKFGTNKKIIGEVTTTSCVMVNTVSLWQQHLKNPQKLHYLASSSKYKTCNFLLLLGGIMAMTEYWRVYVFRQGLYQTCEVQCELDDVHCSYNHFLFHGKMLKMAATPQTHHEWKIKAFDNFSPQKS